jgi:heme oxygenase (biliverdin-IX-beta and delta-forming)
MSSAHDDDPNLARRLVRDARTATLATLATRPSGYPFGSLVAAACDDTGRPVLLLSSLAEHTKNLESSPRASLLYADHAAADPLATARVTVLGECLRVPDAEIEACRALYLARHPEAAAWASFRDFAFYRLEPEDVRLVAGFGKMSWISRDDYLRVR